MSGIDHSHINGRLLQVLLAVLDERSVTRTAARLEVTPSAVSHQLERLRASLLRAFATDERPLPMPPTPMFMRWHQRHQAEPMHQWLREDLLAFVAPALAAAEIAPAP